jgi:hypothetical protein
MGRAAVIVLALANLGFLAWSRGALATFDLVPADLAAREPQRLARQILPERLRVVTPAQEREEARARAEADAQAQARLRAQTREIRTTASATLAGSGTVIGVSEPVVLSVLPALPDPSAPADRSASPSPSTPPAPAASARTSEPSRPATAAR